MITIGGHTFEESLLKDGVIIDIGCRDFTFASYFNPKERDIYCIDLDHKVFENEKASNFHCMNVAIGDANCEAAYYENGEATVLRELDPDQYHKFNPCKQITIEELYKITGENVDIMKMDCEGAEYLILNEAFRPVPKQISVEFHHHTVPSMHKHHFDRIIDMLRKNYDIYDDGMVWEKRHGCDYNFWDVLFIRK